MSSEEQALRDEISRAIEQAIKKHGLPSPEEAAIELAIDNAAAALRLAKSPDQLNPKVFREDSSGKISHIPLWEAFTSLRRAALTGAVVGLLFGPPAGFVAGMLHGSWEGLLKKAPDVLAALFNPKEMEPRDGAIIGALISLQYDRQRVEKKQTFPTTDAVLACTNAALDEDRQFANRRELISRLDSLVQKKMAKRVDGDRWDLGEGVWKTV